MIVQVSDTYACYLLMCLVVLFAINIYHAV